jgi:Ca-activated chloride channel family protein
VLLTDGANTAGHVAPLKAAQLAARQGLRIHTIGVGGAPRTVRGFFGLQQLNPASDLDEKTLKAIAEATGGDYFRATDRKALEAIYERLDQLEPVEKEGQQVRPVDELFFWPLGMALLLSLLLAGLHVRSGIVK